MKTKGQGHWGVKDNVLKEALRYKNRTDFSRKAPGAYHAAWRNGWLDEVCSHMVKNVNNKPRYIYAITWESEKLAYVGLTQSYKHRFNNHRRDKKSIVYKTIKKYGNPKFEVLTPNPVKVENASAAEERWRLKYEELGYETINQIKTGGLGSYSTLWDYDSVKKEALKYTRRSDFKKNSGAAAVWAQRNGVLDEIQSHIPIIMGKWDIFENVEREAKKYRRRLDFQRGCSGAYKGARRNGWLDKLYPK